MYLGTYNFKEAKELISRAEAKPSDFFWDWFCSDSSLERRAMALLKKVEYILKICEIPEDKIRISFKNCCPVEGELYDIFYITSMESSNNRVIIVPRYGFYNKELNKKAEITFDDLYKEFKFDSWRELKKRLKDKEFSYNVRQELCIYE